MDLDSLKHGNSFIVYWFEDNTPHVAICQYEKFSGLFLLIGEDNTKPIDTKFFSYTTCVSSDGSQVSFDKVK